MKVLMLTPYLPYPPLSGGQTRSYNLLKKLSEKHEITLFSLIKDDKEKRNLSELEKYCKKVRVFKRSKNPFTLRNIFKTGFGFYPFLVIRNLVPEERKAVVRELADNKYDLIHAETFYVMPHIPKTDLPILLVDQTIEYRVYKHYVEEQAPLIARPLFSIDVAKLKYWETHFWRFAKGVVAMSNSDKVEMEKLAPGLKIDVVPNGIDEDYFSKRIVKKKPEKPRVLYVGNFKWLQNVEAVKELVEKVWPMIKKKVDNAVLWIVGMNITDEVRFYKGGDIKITEGIKDIREAYQKSDVLVTPIKGPGGTRLKILEAMASSLPVVTTSVGAEGLDVKNGKHVFISNSWKGLATYAVKILSDKKLARKLGREGQKFVRGNYTWNSAANILDGIYRRLVFEDE